MEMDDGLMPSENAIACFLTALIVRGLAPCRNIGYLGVVMCVSLLLVYWRILRSTPYGV